MSAGVMTVPPGEVHLDGRSYYMDGSWSGMAAAGQIVQGTLPDALCVWYETFMERLMRDLERRDRVPAGHC